MQRSVDRTDSATLIRMLELISTWPKPAGCDDVRSKPHIISDETIEAHERILKVVSVDWFNGEPVKLSDHKSMALGVSWTIAGANYDFTTIEVACGQQNGISLNRIVGDVLN